MIHDELVLLVCFSTVDDIYSGKNSGGVWVVEAF
jgi:hypothetical protein